MESKVESIKKLGSHLIHFVDPTNFSSYTQVLQLGTHVTHSIKVVCLMYFSGHELTQYESSTLKAISEHYSQTVELSWHNLHNLLQITHELFFAKYPS